ncbi:MAG: ATPase, T2SS/T4P/T4SS family [Phycisphaerales bacterium]
MKDEARNPLTGSASSNNSGQSSEQYPAPSKSVDVANSTQAANMPVQGTKRLRVGDVLVAEGALTREQLERALSEQKSVGKMIGEVLVGQGVISPGALVRALSKVIGVPGCVLRHGLIDPSLIKSLISAEECVRLKVIPMFRVGDTLTIAMSEPQNLPTLDRIRQLTNCKVRPVLVLESNLLEFVNRYARGDVDIDAFLTSLTEQDVEVVDREAVDEGPETDLDKLVAGNPIINLVNIALLTAVKDKASDIHIEPDKKGTRIRYRIDGVLRPLMKPPASMHAAVVSRVKVIGKMDIAEKRLPQEGRVRIVAEGREIDLRVSSMPTLLGEKVVVRVLDKMNLKVRLEDLGFRSQCMETFKRFLNLSHGMALVTGPTGSGKTTTLYSALDLLRSPDTNILTVEDPVEYQLDMVNQIQVNEAIGLSFSRALRSILRQDPDVIMVGEIRDEATARVAVQAALTGHLVLATLHTNDAPGAVARLVDMGIEPYLLSGALNGAVAQRLARRICLHCETKYFPSEQVLRDAGIPNEAGRPFRKGGGCQRCHNSGFLGRTGVYEVFEVTPEVRRMIHHGRPSHELRAKMKEGGGLSLREEGVLLAIDGQTSLEEILRVTQNDDEEAPASMKNAADSAKKEAA